MPPRSIYPDLPLQELAIDLATINDVRNSMVSLHPKMYDAPFPRRLYKYVPRRFAAAVAAGSIKLGSFHQFALLESNRGDIEGYVEVNPVTVSLAAGENNPTREGLSRIGIASTGPVSIQGMPGSIRFRNAPPDYICDCYSLVPDSTSLLSFDGPQTIFEIKDVDGYLEAYMRAIGVVNIDMGPVTYGTGRSFNSFADPDFKGLAPFYKPSVRERDNYRFVDEQEFRILMKPDTPVNTQSAYPPNQAVARFLEAIAEVG